MIYISSKEDEVYVMLYSLYVYLSIGLSNFGQPLKKCLYVLIKE